MRPAHRQALAEVMHKAWYVFRNRHIAGCAVRTFADALRAAWAFLKRQALPPVSVTRVWNLRPVAQSPIRRNLAGKAYANVRAGDADYHTSRLGR